MAINDLARHLISFVSLLEQLLESIRVLLLVCIETFLQGSLLHFLVAFFLLEHLARVTTRNVLVGEFFLKHILQEFQIRLSF